MAPRFQRTNKINGLKGQISTEGDVWQTVIRNRNNGSRGTEDVKTNECLRDGASRAPHDLPWHMQVSGAGLRNHGGSVCVLPKASMHYLRGHKGKFTGLLYPWEWRKNREYGFFFQSVEQKVSNMEVKNTHPLTHVHTHKQSLYSEIKTEDDSSFYQFSAI